MLISSVIRPVRFTLQRSTLTLNVFQEVVFTYFKQEQQCLYTITVLKLSWGVNNATECFVGKMVFSVTKNDAGIQCWPLALKYQTRAFV